MHSPTGKYLTYIVPPVFYLLVSLAGRSFTSHGLFSWYPSIAKPSFTPPGHVIAAVWTMIYTLSAISVMHFVNTAKGKPYFLAMIGLYVLNGILNAAWSYIFFSRQMLGAAVIDSVLIGITVLLLIVFIWPYSRVSALLLLPYLLWVSFATYLSYSIYRMN